MSAAGAVPDNHDIHNPFRRRLPITFAICVVTSCIATYKVVATQRMRSRNRSMMGKQWWRMVPFLEDCLLLSALTLSYVDYGLLFTATFGYGFGSHLEDLPDDGRQETIGIIMFIAGLLTILSHTITRLSLLISVRRLYSPLPSALSMQHTCDALMAVEILGTIGGIVWVIVVNLQAIQTGNAKVVADMTFKTTVTMCALALGVDVVVLLSPVPLVWEMKRVSGRRRVGIMLVIGVGLLTLVASVVRLLTVINIRDEIARDDSYYLPIFITISQIEAILATLTICLPSAAVIFRWAYSDHQTKRKRKRYLRQHRHHLSTSGKTMLVDTNTDTSQITYDDTPADINGISVTNTVELPTKVTSTAKVEEVSHDHRAADGQREAKVVAQEENVAVEEDEDDDDGNFYELLIPSDKFFPFATQLGPRPTRL